MGRPLNKKYFGNRNIGTTGASDNNIGGQGVAAVTINTAGTYTSALPTATFATPTIPTGVRATGTVRGNALSAVATAAGTGYNLNNILTQTAGGTGVAMATWRVTGLTVVGITLKNGGTANDVGDEFAFNNPNWPTAMRVRVTASNSGVATAIELVDGGVLTTGALPAATDAGGFTRVQTAAGQDFNGSGLEVNFTAWGVATVAVVAQGDYTAISSGAKATSVTPAGGTGATLTITYGVSGVVINEKGSGYVSAADASIEFSGGAAAGTSVLTTDSGNVRSGTNQENAIRMTAWISGAEGAMEADIVKQTGKNRYRVITDDGQGVVQLIASDEFGEGYATIMATDSWGSTYFVTKLTSRLARVSQYQGEGFQFADGTNVHWTLGAAEQDYSVSLSNA
jgi:hypothetical protein